MNQQNINGVDLALVDRGKGPVLLLVHGFPLDGSMWNGQIESLSRHHRVIVPDMRGLGQSGLAGNIATMQQMADDLAALLDALAIDQPITLAGLSMGGYVALAFCKKHSARLKAIVLCDTRAAADSPDMAQNRHATAWRILTEGTSVLAEGMIPRLFAPATLRDRPHVVDAVRRMIRGTNAQGAAAAMLGMAQRDDCTSLLSQIDCPALLVVGSQDIISPAAEMRAMAEAIPDAQLVEIPDAGHLCPMEQPAAFNAAMTAFLVNDLPKSL